MGRSRFLSLVLVLGTVAWAGMPPQTPKPQGSFMPGRTVPDGKLFKNLKSGPCSVQCLENFAEAMYRTEPHSYLVAAQTGKPAGPSEYVRYLTYLYLRPGTERPMVLPEFVGEKREMPVQDPGTQLAIAKAFE